MNDTNNAEYGTTEGETCDPELEPSTHLETEAAMSANEGAGNRQRRSQDIASDRDVIYTENGNIFLAKSRELEELPHVDPTDELSQVPPVAFPIDTELIGIWKNLLAEKALLVLSCYDHDVLFSAAYSIATGFNGMKRQLDLRATNGRSPRLLDSIIRREFDWAPNTLLLLNAVDSTAQGFVDSIVGKGILPTGATERLQKLGTYLLLLTNPDLLAPISELSAYITHASVPFLEPRLRRIVPEKADEMIREIQEQRQRGAWGNSEKQFWLTFRNAELQNKIGNTIVGFRGAVGGSPSVSDNIVIPANAELDSTVLFAATFFPRLSVENFQNLLFRLLGDRRPRLRTAQTAAERTEPDLDSGNQSFVDEWIETYPDVCRRCRLQFLSGGLGENALTYGSQSPVVEFETPLLRGRFREEFLATHYPLLARSFARILEDRWLVDLPSGAEEGLLDLLRTMALADSDRYGSRIIYGLMNPSSANEADCGVREGTPGSALEVPVPILVRISLVLRHFLREPGLQLVVQKFLSSLLDRGQHLDLLNLVRRLRFASHFDPIYWWKQLFDRGSLEARQRTFDDVLLALRTENDQAAEYLAAVFRWLPPSHQRTTSHSVAAANQLLVFLCEAVAQSSTNRRADLSASTPYLAIARTESTGNASVVTWLFHPTLLQFVQAIDRVKRHANKLVWNWILDPVSKFLSGDAKGMGTRWYYRFLDLSRIASAESASLARPLIFQALVLADFSFSLLSLPKAQDGAEASEILDRVTIAVLGECSKDDCHLLGNYWTEILTLLCEIRSELSDSPSPENTDVFRQAVGRLQGQVSAVRELSERFRLAQSRPSKGETE